MICGRTRAKAPIDVLSGLCTRQKPYSLGAPSAVADCGLAGETGAEGISGSY